MCRFALYLGPPITLGSLVTEPEHSIIRQSYQAREREEPLNGDGFGVGWYAPDVTPKPAIFKEISPAWNNANLCSLAAVTVSSCILAHVRAATPGMPVSRYNCHPFSWGPIALMHNGHIAGFHRLMRPLRRRLSDETYVQIQGTTDSEHLLALFIDHWRLSREENPLERMAGALATTFAELDALAGELGVEEPSQLNVAVTDGHRAVVSRHASQEIEPANSLHIHRGCRYVCEAGQARMLPREEPGDAVLVASEPLTRDGHWESVPGGKLVLVRDDLQVELRDLASVPVGAV